MAVFDFHLRAIALSADPDAYEVGTRKVKEMLQE